MDHSKKELEQSACLFFAQGRIETEPRKKAETTEREGALKKYHQTKRMGQS